MATSQYSVLRQGTQISAELHRKKSRFLTVLRRTDSAEEAYDLVKELRAAHPGAAHHCSAWLIGPDRRVQRANDDGEPSGTAGAPMLEALARAQMPNGMENLSDLTAVVVRWFGGTLLGSGGLVSAYSESVVAALTHAESENSFLQRQRMRRFTLSAPIAEAGRWENELRTCGVLVQESDYLSAEGRALLHVAVLDTETAVRQLRGQAAALSSGAVEAQEIGIDWVDAHP